MLLKTILRQNALTSEYLEPRSGSIKRKYSPARLKSFVKIFDIAWPSLNCERNLFREITKQSYSQLVESLFASREFLSL